GGKTFTPAEAEKACRRAGIDHRRRGETLSLEEFAALADAVRARAAEGSDTGEAGAGGVWGGDPGPRTLAASGGD
ncbi:MAG: hypothetical protein ACRDHY_19440, partial [Anaerolineales bacterium]